MDIKTLIIAVFAGAACVLMIAASGHAGAGALPLMLLAPFPIYAAAFGWGTNAALLASATAIIGAGISVSPNWAIVTGLMFSIPASVIGHQANLAQQREDGSMEWYPLSRLFFNLCLLLAIGFCVALIYSGYEQTKEASLPLVSQFIGQLMAQNPLYAELSEIEKAQIDLATFNLLPFWFSSVWLIIHAVNISLAAFICRASGVMPRPRDDVPSSIFLPLAAIGILIVGLVLTLLVDGSLQYYSGPFFGIFLTAFSLVGLAMLHKSARANAANFILLMVSYVLILMFYLPMLVFAGAGILRTITRSKNTPAPPGPNKP